MTAPTWGLATCRARPHHRRCRSHRRLLRLHRQSFTATGKRALRGFSAARMRPTRTLTIAQTPRQMDCALLQERERVWRCAPTAGLEHAQCAGPDPRCKRKHRPSFLGVIMDLRCRTATRARGTRPQTTIARRMDPPTTGGAETRAGWTRVGWCTTRRRSTMRTPFPPRSGPMCSATMAELDPCLQNAPTEPKARAAAPAGTLRTSARITVALLAPRTVAGCSMALAQMRGRTAAMTSRPTMPTQTSSRWRCLQASRYRRHRLHHHQSTH